MKSYRIADLTVNYDSSGRTLKLSEKYEIPYTDAPDMTLCVNQTDKEKFKKLFPNAEVTDWEYFIFSTYFAWHLIENNGFVFHSSAVAVNGNAYLFSGNSGAGKSTHTQLWLKNFSGCEILNDDKPAIRLNNGIFTVYGTPWSGKSDLNENKSALLKGICFVQKGDHNSIKRLTPLESIPKIMEQTLRRSNYKRTEIFLNLLDALLKTIPVYSLTCLPDDDAAKLSFKTMTQGKNNE